MNMRHSNCTVKQTHYTKKGFNNLSTSNALQYCFNVVFLFYSFLVIIVGYEIVKNFSFFSFIVFFPISPSFSTFSFFSLILYFSIFLLCFPPFPFSFLLVIFPYFSFVFLLFFFHSYLVFFHISLLYAESISA